MHCLPVRRNMIVSDDVIEGAALTCNPRSRQPRNFRPGGAETNARRSLTVNRLNGYTYT